MKDDNRSSEIPVEHETEDAAPVDPSADTSAATAPEGDAPGTTGSDLESRARLADEYYDRLLRLTADFDNFRKRAARDRSDAIRYANEALLERLLPSLDHFDMALNAVGKSDPGSVDALITGIRMVHDQLRAVLREVGLEEINASGQPFDPAIHEAVSQVESTDVPEGHVAEQVRRGYRLHDRLLRPASVVVARSPEQTPS